jgi:hypothetical protein
MPSPHYIELYMFQNVATIPSLSVFLQDCGVQETMFSNIALGVDTIGEDAPVEMGIEIEKAGPDESGLLDKLQSPRESVNVYLCLQEGLLL